jgi:hypothetical protein
MKLDMVKKVPAEKAERFKKLEMEAIQKKYPLIDKNSFEIFTEATEKFSQADDMSKTRKRHDGPSLDEI